MESLLGTLGINWKLFIGQIINFLLFLLILRIFVYKPLLHAMHERQKKIKDGLLYADKFDVLKAELALERKQMAKDARREADALIVQASEKAKALESSILEKAHAESEELLEHAKIEIALDKESAQHEMKKYVGDLSIKIAEKILSEKLDPIREEKLIRSMIDES